MRLSPMDAPGAYVRHYGYRLRVDGDVRPLADTQFRIVPGFLGSNRVAMQSVNFPDRYVRVDGDSLRIDPYADSDAYGRAASLVQVPGLADHRATSLHLSNDPHAYITMTTDV